MPRTRFAPVKTTDDLLVLRSDLYRLSDDARVEHASQPGSEAPFVELDRDHFGHLEDFERRLPFGPPSLVGAQRLVVRGDVTFGAGVVVRGSVEVAPDGDRPLHIPDGAVLG